MKLGKKIGLSIGLAFLMACSSGVSAYKKKKRKPKNKKKCDCPSFSYHPVLPNGKMSEKDSAFYWNTQI